jgi:hypothetical protein
VKVLRRRSPVRLVLPGMVPLTNQNTWVRFGPGFEFVTKYTERAAPLGGLLSR